MRDLIIKAKNNCLELNSLKFLNLICDNGFEIIMQVYKIHQLYTHVPAKLNFRKSQT